MHEKLTAESHWIRHGPKKILDINRSISLEDIDTFLDGLNDSIFPRQEKKDDSAKEIEESELNNGLIISKKTLRTEPHHVTS